eukprot:4033528-Amphidinium_carterae.1
MPVAQDMVSAWFGKHMKRKKRVPHLKCCYSSLRRYLPTERRSLPVHQDAPRAVNVKYISVTISLNNMSDYEGGLIMYPRAQRDGFLGRPVQPVLEVGRCTLLN